MDENATTTPDTLGKEQPEKYVRTFAGDMETVQKGGVPDLAPLKQSHGTPSERLVEASLLAPTPNPSPTQTPPEQQAPAYTPPVPLEAPIKTYAGDFMERMKETRASTATVLAAEQDASPRTPSAISEKPSRGSLLYVSAGIILLIAGGVGAYIAYTRYLSASAPIVSVQEEPAPIFVDEREQISGTGTALLEAVTRSVARSLAPGSIRLLSVASTTTGSVFAALPLSAPAVLLRNVNADGSMAGVIHAGGSQNPFFILSVSSYSNTFAGMLSWEPTMPRNLAVLFPTYPSQSVSTTTATTSPATGLPKAGTTTRASAAQSGFHDEVVGNHDVRIYRDEAGQSVVLYGYWNQTTLVIARDPSAFTEILQRLATSRTQS